jgi:GT2 family glycosyltransferase
MSAPAITIILVGYNSEQWLDRCLTTLPTASSGRLQLCFVDNLNNPTFSTFDLSAVDVEVLKTPQPLGFADANNFALQNTRFSSDLTVFLNQDTVSGDGWIDRCSECFAADDRLGILSPGLRTYELDQWEPNLVACVRESGLDPQVIERPDATVIPLHQVTAAAMVMRTELLNSLGPFDPIFGSYYEDYDLCRRVREAGYGIAVCPPATVGHFSGSVSSNEAARKRRSRIIIRNRLIHRLRENTGHRKSLLLQHLLYTLPVNLLRGLLRTPSSQPVSATIAAHWDLLKIAGRLISQSRDNRLWHRFLTEFNSNISSPGHSADSADIKAISS